MKYNKIYFGTKHFKEISMKNKILKVGNAENYNHKTFFAMFLKFQGQFSLIIILSWFWN